MALTEAERSALYESMRQIHGADVAQSIMTVYPHTDADEPATKRDLIGLGSQLRSEIAALRAEMTGLRGEMTGEITALRGEVDGLRGEVKGEIGALRGDIGTMKADLLKTFGAWLFASQAGVVAAVTIIVALIA